jgi:hypothetical protein
VICCSLICLADFRSTTAVLGRQHRDELNAQMGGMRGRSGDETLPDSDLLEQRKGTSFHRLL